MTKIAVSEARKDLSEIVNQVCYGGERVVLQRRGRDIVAVISVEDLQLLEALEDHVDREQAKKSLKESEKRGTVPWSKVKRELGL